MSIPLHVAIIPDANRRWARKRGLEPWEGHEEGAKNLEKILEAAHECGVRYLSFWGSSEDNLRKRPLLETKALLDIYCRYFKKLITSKRVHDNQIQIKVLGDWERQFPSSLKKIIYDVIEKTKNYNKFFVTFFLAYSGDKEMMDAVEAIARDYQSGAIKKVTEGDIKNHLITKDLPSVDLLIRTGSTDDPHLSNGFMMWETRNSQLFFSEKEWPDFDKEEFKCAISNYGERVRRYGA